MQKGDFIRVKYSGKIKENNLELDTVESAPLIIGASWILKGFEEEVEKMNVGDKKTVEIPAEKGFGPRDPKLIKLVTETEFKKHGEKPVVGMVINADNMRGRVLSVASGRVKIDFNHPLAGKVLIFDIEIKNKIIVPEEKVKAIVEFFSRQPTDKVEVKINGHEVEILVPPIISSIYKKKIANEIIKHLDKTKIKFLEVYEKPSEEAMKRVDDLDKELDLTDVSE